MTYVNINTMVSGGGARIIYLGDENFQCDLGSKSQEGV